jgi:nitrogen regulatory protein A
MLQLEEQIQEHLDSFRAEIGADFVALALTEPDHVIRWKYASGNRNDRYKRIVLRPGKGLAGKVMCLGRPIQMKFDEPQSMDDPRDYPILLAEGLKSLVGVPINSGERIPGMMLVGCRAHREFSPEEIAHISAKANEFLEMIKL